MVAESHPNADTDAGGKTTSDTRVCRLIAGMRVTITAGELDGIQGVVMERRPGGKMLLRVADALYVEIHEFWLIAVDRD